MGVHNFSCLYKLDSLRNWERQHYGSMRHLEFCPDHWRSYNELLLSDKIKNILSEPESMDYVPRPQRHSKTL